MNFDRRWFLGHAVAAAGIATAPLSAAPAGSSVAGRLVAALDELRIHDSHAHLIPD